MMHAPTRQAGDALVNLCGVLSAAALLMLLVAGADHNEQHLVQGPALRSDLDRVVDCGVLVPMVPCASVFAMVREGAPFAAIELGEDGDPDTTLHRAQTDLCVGGLEADHVDKDELGVCSNAELPWYALLFLVVLVLFTAILCCACVTVILA